MFLTVCAFQTSDWRQFSDRDEREHTVAAELIADTAVAELPCFDGEPSF